MQSSKSGSPDSAARNSHGITPWSRHFAVGAARPLRSDGRFDPVLNTSSPTLKIISNHHLIILSTSPKSPSAHALISPFPKFGRQGCGFLMHDDILLILSSVCFIFFSVFFSRHSLMNFCDCGQKEKFSILLGVVCPVLGFIRS
jgi:hypothetical protein